MHEVSGMRRIRSMRNVATVRKKRNDSQSIYLKLHILITQKEKLLKEKNRWEERVQQINRDLAVINTQISELRAQEEDERGGVAEGAASRTHQNNSVVLEY